MRRQQIVTALILTFLSVLIAPTLSFAQETCGPAVAACRNALFVTQDINAADDACAVAVASDPSDGCARIFRAATRVLRVAGGNTDGSDPTTFTDSVKEMLDRAGVSATGRDVYSFAPLFPRDVNGEVALPSDSPDGTDVQEALEALFVSAIKDSVADLRTVAAGTVIIVSASEQLVVLEAGGTNNATPAAIEIDFGDSKLFESALLLWQSKLQLLSSLDLNADIDSYTPIQNEILIQQEILDANPDLLVLLPSASSTLNEANQANRGAVAAYLTASAFIRSEIDDQTDDLFTIEPTELANEADVRTQLATLFSSFDGPTPILNTGTSYVDEEAVLNSIAPLLGSDLRDQGAVLDLGLFYNVSPFDLRAMLPTFDIDNAIVDGSLPDRTFGGVLTTASAPPPASPLGTLDDFERGRLSISDLFFASGEQIGLNPTGSLEFDRYVFVGQFGGVPGSVTAELGLTTGDDEIALFAEGQNGASFELEYDFAEPQDLTLLGGAFSIELESIALSSGTSSVTIFVGSDSNFGFSSADAPVFGPGTFEVAFTDLTGNADLTQVDFIVLILDTAFPPNITDSVSATIDDVEIVAVPQPIPEPTSALPFGLGLITWMAARRSKSRG